MDGCLHDIERFLERRTADWSGLEAGCSLDDVTSRWSFRDGDGSAQLGTSLIDYHFRVLTWPGFAEGVFFYFRDGRLALLRANYWSFDATECAEVLRQLGSPEHRLDLFWNEQVIGRGEWVWPGRGIAVALLPETRIIAWMTVFTACALAQYEAEYRSTGRCREFPRRSD